MYEYSISQDMYDTYLEALSVKKENRIIKWASTDDIVDYLNKTAGLNRKITSLAIS